MSTNRTLASQIATLAFAAICAGLLHGCGGSKDYMDHMAECKNQISRARVFADAGHVEQALALLKPITTDYNSAVRLEADEAVIYCFAVNRQWDMMHSVCAELGQTPRGEGDLEHSLGYQTSLDTARVKLAGEISLESAKTFKKMTSNKDFLYLRDMCNAGADLQSTGCDQQGAIIFRQITPLMQECCKTQYEYKFLKKAEIRLAIRPQLENMSALFKKRLPEWDKNNDGILSPEELQTAEQTAASDDDKEFAHFLQLVRQGVISPQGLKQPFGTDKGISQSDVDALAACA